MISYKPFYDQLLRKGITEYELIYKHGLSANTIHRIKKGEAITTKTLDTLCFILIIKNDYIVILLLKMMLSLNLRVTIV